MSATSLIAISLFATSTKGLSIPERTCLTQWDCQQNQWTSPYPTCENNQCQCDNGSCIVYTNSGSNYLFYCGTCGTLGSECNSRIECDVETCSDDNFCHCRRGEVYRELCVIYEPIPTTITSVVLIAVLIALLVFLKLFKSRNRIKQYCFNRCSDTNSVQSTVIGFNPNSHQKSAAYTITNSEFMVTSNDSELEWALELSRGMSTVWEDGVSMDYPTWSSAASSNRHHAASRSRINSLSGRLEDTAEPGVSGVRRDRRSVVIGTRSTLSSSSSGSSCYRQRTPMSSSMPSSFSSRSTSTTRRSTTPSIQASRRSIRSITNSQSITLSSIGSSRSSSCSNRSSRGSNRGSSCSSSGSNHGHSGSNFSTDSSANHIRTHAGTPSFPDVDSVFPSESES